ncbi:MAG: hydroxymethylbilane synthase [Flavobacteriales bacterium Tduv]
MNTSIRIGTRNSPLALWQAEKVQAQFTALGHTSELVSISSEGDRFIDVPFHEMNAVGIFTRALIQAMLSGEVDIAVHSLKDLPTILPDEIALTGCLERGNPRDILVYKGSDAFLHDSKINTTIATGSLRRQAFWKNYYPHHHLATLRGNINTRLQKLIQNDWNGSIFSQAGLERIGLLEQLADHNLKYITLDWMIPAPAQGVIAVTVLKKDKDILRMCDAWSYMPTRDAVIMEREFLNKLEGGCTAPIGAYTFFKEGKIHFNGALLSPDGKRKVEKYEITPNFDRSGAHYAQEILEHGGREILQDIRAYSEQKIL